MMFPTNKNKEIKVKDSNTSSSTLGLSQEQCPSHQKNQESKNLKRRADEISKPFYQDHHLEKIDEVTRNLYERYQDNHENVKKNINDFGSGKKLEPLHLPFCEYVTNDQRLNIYKKDYQKKNEYRIKLEQEFLSNKPNNEVKLEDLTNKDVNILQKFAQLNEELKTLKDKIIETDCYIELERSMNRINESLDQESKKKKEEALNYLKS